MWLCAEGATVRLEAPLEFPRSGTHVSILCMECVTGSNVDAEMCQRVVDLVRSCYLTPQTTTAFDNEILFSCMIAVPISKPSRSEDV